MQGQSALDSKNMEKAHEGIIRAQDIIREFQATLNMDYEVSLSLNSIYDYMHRQLIQANINKDRDMLEEVLGFAKELRDTWAQAMKLAKNQAPSAERIAK
jgi:flagellar biosynthetic protein FliS